MTQPPRGAAEAQQGDDRRRCGPTRGVGQDQVRPALEHMDLGGLAGLLRDRIRACTDDFPELLLVLLLLVVTEVDAAGCCRTKPHAGSTTRPAVVSTFVGSASGTRSPLLVSTGVGLVVTVVAKHVRNLGRVIVMAPSALLGLRQDVGEAVDLSLPVRKWETEAAAIAGNADAGDAVDAER